MSFLASEREGFFELVPKHHSGRVELMPGRGGVVFFEDSFPHFKRLLLQRNPVDPGVNTSDPVVECRRAHEAAIQKLFQ